MAGCTTRITLILLFWISKIRLISSSAPYCEFNLCDENHYCCRNNYCCPNENFYIVAWILAGFIIVAITCCGLYKYKNQLYRFFSRGSESSPLTAVT